MMRTVIVIAVVIAFMTAEMKGQHGSQNKSGFSISGRVFDKTSQTPMEYATISLLRKDSSLVNGTITDAEGDFSIHTPGTGDFILKAGFLGYERYMKNLKIESTEGHLNIGKIFLKPTSNMLGEVSVAAEKSNMEYKIDKKVVHVGDNLAAISGNAVDVLSNVPSVQVDIEGNVSLRGNSNFTVLIDDRPTVLDANEALQQIPASTIKDIEIITNPSAKYDPEGTGGIINIITKKRTLEGISGLIHADAGLDDKYGADFLLNYRTKKFNHFIGAEYSDRTYPGEIETEFNTYDQDTTNLRTSSGDYRRMYTRYNIRGGVEWFPNDNLNLRLTGNYGFREWSGRSTAVYETWQQVNDEVLNRNSYQSTEKSTRGGEYYSANMDLTYEFSSREHKLDLEAMYFKREGEENSTNTLLSSDDQITSSQKSSESGPASGFRYRVNYKQPFSDALKIEAGMQGRMGNSNEKNEIYYYEPLTAEYVFQSDFSHDVNYYRNYNAIYGLFLGEISDFGYQLGLRAENTDRFINLENTEDEYTVNRWDLFPTAHMSYQLSEKQQLMASYTRRIDRPRGWYFEPFYTWRDAYNVRIGNPGLLPEYINSYEMAYQRDFNDNSISAEVFYRTTKNKIEGIRSAFNDSVTLRTYENVGTDYSLGTEIMLNLDIFDQWESNLTGDFYNYRVQGAYNNQEFDKSSFTWSVRWNNIIKLTRTTRLQINPAYHGPELEAQEKETGFFIAHGAIRQSLLNNKMDVTLQVRDIFSTGKHESEIDAADLYSYRLYTHKSPILMVNLTWRINNYKNRNGMHGGNGIEGGEGMD